MTSCSDQFDEKWRRCQLDAAMKSAGGVLLGGLGSLMFLQKALWPLYLGSAVGIGIAYRNCEQDIKTLTANEECEGSTCKNRKTEPS